MMLKILMKQNVNLKKKNFRTIVGRNPAPMRLGIYYNVHSESCMYILYIIFKPLYPPPLGDDHTILTDSKQLLVSLSDLWSD